MKAATTAILFLACVYKHTYGFACDWTKKVALLFLQGVWNSIHMVSYLLTNTQKLSEKFDAKFLSHSPCYYFITSNPSHYNTHNNNCTRCQTKSPALIVTSTTAT